MNETSPAATGVSAGTVLRIFPQLRLTVFGVRVKVTAAQECKSKVFVICVLVENCGFTDPVSVTLRQTLPVGVEGSAVV